MNKLLVIEGDWNDGDIVTQVSQITEEDYRKLIPIIVAIRDQYNSNAINDDDLTDDTYPQYLDNVDITNEQKEWFDQYVPSGENGPIHTIESIKVYEYTNELNLL